MGGRDQLTDAEKRERHDEIESHHDGRPKVDALTSHGFDPLLDKLRHEHPEHRRGDIAPEAAFED